MKLKNIFKLYKSYYPSAEPYRVTIAGCGAVQVSDSRCASRLCVGAAPGVRCRRSISLKSSKRVMICAAAAAVASCSR